jgi:hypothetical protein
MVRQFGSNVTAFSSKDYLETLNNLINRTWLQTSQPGYQGVMFLDEIE